MKPSGHTRVGDEVEHRAARGEDVGQRGRGLEGHQHHALVLVAHAHGRDMRHAVGRLRGDHGLEDLLVHPLFFSGAGRVVPGAHQASRFSASRSTAQPQSSGWSCT